MTDRTSVLFVCTHNSCRSQMAEALLALDHGEKHEAYSAGTEARGVHPLAIQVLEELEIDMSQRVSKKISDLPRLDFDVVVTVCDDAKEACPYLPAKTNLHQAFSDPSRLEGDDEEVLAAFRHTRDEIRSWIQSEFG